MPTVAAALANLPQRASAAAPATARPPAEATALGPQDLVAMAVGVLMHRYSLQRGQALARLHKLAADEQRGLSDQAGRLIEAVELLARGNG